MCSERSGSNLITQILNSHPQICAPATKHLINPVARNFFRYQELSSPDNWYELLQDIHSLLNADFSEWVHRFAINDLHQLAHRGDIGSLIKRIFEAEAEINKKSHLFIKENHLYEFMPFLLIHFPESKFIYQTRDPRDMALSWRKSQTHPGGIVAAAKQWAKDQKKFLPDFHTLKSIGRSHHLTYEALITEPKKTINDALTFLGLEYSGEILDFHKNETTIKNANKQKVWSNLCKPILTENSNKFTSELSNIEICMIEKTCYYEMKALGYQTIFSLNELEALSEKEMEKFASNEEKEYPANRSKGTLENIVAKRNFYRR
jgi:hypothetical protein